MSAPSRYVTDPLAELPDPAERFRLYTLCVCETCGGTGKVSQMQYERHPNDPEDVVPIGRRPARCTACRGEGRVRELQATCDSPEALGVALVTLGREGQFDDENGHPCPIGVLDTIPEEGERKWLVLPWLPSARNLTDAGRALGKQSARKRKTNQKEER